MKDLTEEFDEKEREATVYLVLRITDRVKIDWEIFNHWGLVVDFGNRKICYEIAKHDTCAIISPRWSSFVPPESSSKEIELGTVTTSPAAVREKARTNRLSYKKYNVLNQNCQEWVEIMLKSMDERLLERLKAENIRSLGKALLDTFQQVGRFSSGSAPAARKQISETAKKYLRPNCLNPEDDEN
jgi:hypothetical protein